MTDFNTQVIEEFRANEGRVGGFFEGRPMIILHTTGAKTGTARLVPLVYQDLGGSYAVFASKGGAPDNPDWYYNLVAHPQIKIEVGTKTLPVTARVATGAERERIWTRQTTDWENFAEYERKTDREIPVIVLDPS